MTRWATAGVLAAFAALCLCRLNGFSLLEPDTPEYFFGAQSLASFDGYREIDRPGHPPHTFRPPGLSLMLVPLTWIAPYAVVAAKLIVIALALVAVGLTIRLASREGPTGWPVIAGLIVASSPYALLHATEVVTEFPYLACSLGAILIMTSASAPPSRREILLAGALLIYLPFLRTVGLALVIATLIWCLAIRSRRPFWPAPVAALAASFLWMWRNAAIGGPTYVGAIEAGVKRDGGSGLGARSMETAGFYAGRFLEVLLPGMWPGRPLYERMSIGGTADLSGLYGAGLVVGLLIVSLAVYGAWSRRGRDGALIALYAAGFAAALAVYPPRHERLTWPLVPLVVVMAISGISRLRRPVRIGALAVAAALVLWQGALSIGLARDNLAWAGGGDRFYADRIPPLYFADWRHAGAWLREHAPAGASVLTRHSDVGFTSGLAQDSVRFEELPPSVWRPRIAKLEARYLVVPTTLFGKFFPLDLVASDPVYAYAVRFQGRDVAVIEVTPNRTGRVSPAAPPGAEHIAACERALAQDVKRVELATRCAELIASSGKRDEAIARLRALMGRGFDDVRVQIALGQLLLDAGDAPAAAAAFHAASLLPEADLLEQTIARGKRSAEDMAAGRRADPLARARAFMDDLRWEEARALLDPENAAALQARGEIEARMGDYAAAVASYRASAERGNPAAMERADALSSALGVESSLTTAAPNAILWTASFWAGEGAPGKALALLEQASTRFPDEPAIASRIRDLRRFYGLD